MAKKKPVSKPAKKAAATKPVKKAAVKKAVAKAPAKKSVAKKAAVKKPAPAKKLAVKKAAPAKAAKAKPAAKPAKKAPKTVKKTTVKPAPAGKPAATKKVAAKSPAAKAPAKAVKKAVAKPTKKEAIKPVKAAPKAAPKSAAKKTAPVPAPKAAPAKPRARKRAKEDAAPKVPARPLVTMGVGPSMPRVTPMVKKQVSTLEAGDKDRYTDSDLEEFRTIINNKLEEARKDYALLKQTLANTDNNGTEDTSPSFKMIEDGSETLGREETAQLAGRQEKFIKHLEDALLRIRNKTYGICRVTGRLISKERLRLVPHATLSIEAKQQMSN